MTTTTTCTWTARSTLIAVGNETVKVCDTAGASGCRS